jgi:hypothetical protein
MKKILLSILLISIKFSFAQMPIGTVRTQALSSTVTFRGKVLNGSELGIIRYVQDGTGGIGVYSSSIANVLRGDSIEVTGTLFDFNTLLEISPVSTFTVTKISETPLSELSAMTKLTADSFFGLPDASNAFFSRL